MRYMLDTNICIYLMKAQSESQAKKNVLARLTGLNYGDAVMSIVTYAELRVGIELSGASRLQNEQALQLLVRDVPVLAFDETAAESYGVMRAALRDRRRDALDRLIAAHALSLGIVLVTNNEADFKDYAGLKLENWV
jgi:tRNA(fMet)-specific endonuclease VapC